MRHRVLLYSDDTVGLGHISRAMTIAQELVWGRNDLAVLIASGSPAPSTFDCPNAVDLLRLPSHTRRVLYDNLPSGDVSPPPGLYNLGPEPGIWYVRAEILEAAARAFEPHVFVSDFHANGVRNELIPALLHLGSAGRTRRLLLLNEFDNFPEEQPDVWAGSFGDLLRTEYDQIMIWGDERVFPTATAYGLPTDVLPKVSYSGYAAKVAMPQQIAAARRDLSPDGRPLIVVHVGGGQDGAPVLLATAEALSTMSGIESLLVTGPLLPPTEHARLEALVSGSAHLRVERSRSDLVTAIAAADLVVSMAGYSTIAEIMTYRKRAIVIPRAKPWLEQLVRAVRLAELGLVTMIHPDDLTVEGLRGAIETSLAGPPPDIWVDCDGGRRIAAKIRELAGAAR